MDERIRINSEDTETGEYAFVYVTPETARDLIKALQFQLDKT